MFGFGSKKETLMGLMIYMKSGNKIFTDNIVDYSFKRGENGITSAEITYSVKTPPTLRLRLATVDLSQIEAIVEL